MSWIEVKAVFSTPPQDFSPFIELFQEYGIDNTLESEDALTGCIPNVPGAEERVVDLTEKLLETAGVHVEVGQLEETNWEIAWRQFFKPRRVAKRFVVVPTWETYERQPGDNVIRLDPGQAFGTGDHPTTRMCLELMESIEFVGRDVADIGCGSGILAIGAAQLGGIVEAFDIDPIAVEVAKSNVNLNGVPVTVDSRDGLRPVIENWKEAPQDETKLQTLQTAETTADLAPCYHIVLSNIISMTLARIAPQVSHVLHPAGHWIISGIITDNWPGLQTSLEAEGFITRQEASEDGWIAALLQKDPAKPATW